MEPPITKKEACSILNITYNTTRLGKIIDEHVGGGVKRSDTLENASEDSKVTPIFTNNINKATNDVFENFRESAIEINGGENENIECSEEEKDEIIHTGQDNTTRKQKRKTPNIKQSIIGWSLLVPPR